MHTFFMLITLTALSGPTVSYFGPDHFWASQAACEAALPKMEAVINRIMASDPDMLGLIGTVVGEPSRAYFIKMSECRSAEAAP